MEQVCIKRKEFVETGNQHSHFYYITIPNFIIEDTKIPDGEKILFGMIAAYSLKNGYCWFSNKFISERLKVGERTASRWVNHLKEKNYIKIEITRKEKEIISRKIRINISNLKMQEYMHWYSQNCLYPIDTDGNTSIDKNGVVINKDNINKDLINLKDLKNSSDYVLIDEEEYEKLVEEFGNEKVFSELEKYKKWKHKYKAHPNSDLETFRNWLIRACSNKFMKKQTAVQETGCDEVSDKELENLPF